jgi:flagellar biogenesis protein FliO
MLQSIRRQSALYRAGIGGWGTIWRRLLHRVSRRSVASGALEHLGSLPLTAQSSLALVRLNKETLLLGITPQSITLLTKEREEKVEGAPKADLKKNPARSARLRAQELAVR